MMVRYNEMQHFIFLYCSNGGILHRFEYRKFSSREKGGAGAVISHRLGTSTCGGFAPRYRDFGSKFISEK